MSSVSLPSGYSVAYNGVFDPAGKTISFFPSSVLQSVIAQPTTTSDPGAPNATPTSPSGSSSDAAPSGTAAAGASGQNGATLAKPSLVLAAVFALVMTVMA